jgi:putative transposase
MRLNIAIFATDPNQFYDASVRSIPALEQLGRGANRAGGQGPMARFIKLLPGMTVRWHGRRYEIVDCADFDTIVCREFGKRRLQGIPITEVEPDRMPGGRVPHSPDLVSVPKNVWQAAARKLAALKPLLAMDPVKRSRAQVSRVAKAIGKHPATIYRWMHQYESAERLSGLLRKDRSDRGKSRLTRRLDGIVDEAIKKFYLTAENPHMTAVIEEVDLQCFKQKIKKRPHPNTIRARIAKLSDRLKLEKRKGKKAAEAKYEPIKGHFPGADVPLAVAQIDHTPMDVIVVDEEFRQPIQRPFLTVVIDVCSRMVLGFTIYLEKPSAFTAGVAIAHAVLPKEDWLAAVGVQAEWPCWGKMRIIHCKGVSNGGPRVRKPPAPCGHIRRSCCWPPPTLTRKPRRCGDP